MDHLAYPTSTDHWMYQAPVQITGCASIDHRCSSTDRRMHNFRPGNVVGRARDVVEKKEMYWQHQRIKSDL